MIITITNAPLALTATELARLDREWAERAWAAEKARQAEEQQFREVLASARSAKADAADDLNLGWRVAVD